MQFGEAFARFLMVVLMLLAGIGFAVGAYYFGTGMTGGRAGEVVYGLSMAAGAIAGLAAAFIGLAVIDIAENTAATERHTRELRDDVRNAVRSGRK